MSGVYSENYLNNRLQNEQEKDNKISLINRRDYPEKSKHVKIGVLGGIGPEATALFYSKLIKKIQEELRPKNNTYYPQIIINSVPAPELTNNTITKKELIPYIKGIQELNLNKPDFIIMVCNTIHLYHKKLQDESPSKIINLREKVLEELEKTKEKRLLILGSPSTAKKLYKHKKVKIVQPTKKEQLTLARAIFLYNKGTNKKSQLKTVRRICKKYLQRKAEKALIACTEFSAMLEKEKVEKLDTITVLLRATIQEIQNKQQELKN